MDNDKLLKEISATLEALAGKIDTALAGVSDDRLKCNSGSCPHYAGGGRCTATDACVLATEGGNWAKCEHEPAVSGKPCNEPCINIKCQYMKSGSCLRPTTGTCVTRITPPADVPVEEVLQGYTLAQWDEIRVGGYLCQFSSDMTFRGPFVGPLDEIELGLFVCGMRERWGYCRPAQIPGVLRPWFGGDCPVDPGAKVFSRLRSGTSGVGTAESYQWGHGLDHLTADLEIIAYMEV